MNTDKPSWVELITDYETQVSLCNYRQFTRERCLVNVHNWLFG